MINYRKKLKQRRTYLKKAVSNSHFGPESKSCTRRQSKMARLHKLSFNTSVINLEKEKKHQYITLLLFVYSNIFETVCFWLTDTNRKLIFYSKLETLINIPQFHVDPQNNELNNNPVSPRHEILILITDCQIFLSLNFSSENLVEWSTPQYWPRA